MNWSRHFALALGALLLLAGPAWGSGFATSEHYAGYIGQATAGMTLMENAGVVAHLPASMVRLEEGGHAMGGLVYFDPKFDWEAEGKSGSTVTDDVISPHGFGVYNRGQYALGLGVYFPYNVDIEYPSDWPGREELVREKLVVGYTALAGAYAFNEDFSAGVTVNFINAWANLKRRIVVAPGTEIPVELGGTADTVGGSASVLYHSDHWSVGLRHSPKYTLEIDGKVKFDTSAAPGLASSFPDGGGSVDLLMPSVTDFAVSYHDRRSDPDYMVELNLVRTGWSNFRELRIRFASGKPAAESVAERNWKDTLGIKLGGNYVFSRSGDTSHRVRAGIFRDEGMAPARTLDPAVPDTDGRMEYAVGYGYKQGGFFVDASYFYIDFLEAKASADNPFPATYDGQVNIYAVSGGYHW